MAKELNEYAELYPGRTLKALGKEFDFGKKKPVFTIKNVIADKLNKDDDDDKVLVILQETEQVWVLSKINGEALKHMFGKNINNWIGKRVCLYATDKIVPFPAAKGDDRFCIRVYGSPEMANDLSFEFKMPRRAPITITLRGPSKKPTTTAQEQAPQATEPEPEPFMPPQEGE